jgi:hypothetical protein
MLMTSFTSLRRLAGAGFLTAAVLLLVLPAAGAAPADKQAKLHYPIRTLLTNSTIGHWAVVVHHVGAHKLPSS